MFVPWVHAVSEEDKGTLFVGKDRDAGARIARVAAAEGGSARGGSYAIRPKSCIANIGARIGREVHEPDCPAGNFFCGGKDACVARDALHHDARQRVVDIAVQAGGVGALGRRNTIEERVGR